MAYTLEIGIHNSILEWIHNKEVYLNDVRIDDPESYSFGTKVEINHNDKLKIVLSAENKRICYSKDGKYVSAIPEGTFSKSLPLGNYRFYTEDCYDDDFIEGYYQATILVTFKHPLEGTKPVYKRVNGGWRKQTAYERAEGWWVKLSTTDTISFTIDGETWYARSGMTWSEWCNANDYSLNSCHIFGTKVAPLDNSKYIVGVTGNIDGDDKIIAGSNYITKQPTTDGSYDISVAFSGAYLSVTPYSTNPTSISSGETVTLKYDWTSNGATPDAVNVSNCEYSKSYTGTKSGVLTITLSNPSDDVVVNVRFEK